MRIISGEFRGFNMKTPKGTDTRPTTDRVKESVFNIINSMKYIKSDSTVLDLFSGSGSIGLEFLSRGAEKAYFIDSSKESIGAINENIKKCRVEEQTKAYRNDVIRALDMLSQKGEVFDYIFMDPPYDKDMVLKVLEQIDNTGILAEKGVIIVEHESKLKLPETIGGLSKIDNRKYGTTVVSFFVWGEKVE